MTKTFITRDEIEMILKRMDETDAEYVNLDMYTEDGCCVEEVMLDLWKDHNFIETVVDLL